MTAETKVTLAGLDAPSAEVYRILESVGAQYATYMELSELNSLVMPADDPAHPTSYMPVGFHIWPA